MNVLVTAVVLALAAVAVAMVLQRRRPAPPTQGSHHVPTQLDRSDFGRGATPWVIVVFTSSTCRTCAAALAAARSLAAADVSVFEAEVTRDAALHQRYGIDGVPTTVIADDEGVVWGSLLGPVDAGQLGAEFDAARERLESAR